MKRSIVKSGFQLAAAAALITFATVARSDPGGLEIGVGTAYTRGVGAAAGAAMPRLQDLAGGGGTLRIEVGWRIDPRWEIGVYHENVLLAAGDMPGAGRATGHALGVQGRLHVAPSRLMAGWAARIDPWIGLGAGWRSLSIDHGGGDHALQGIDLARLELGVDWHVSRAFAVAPTFGVSATEFLSEKRPGERAWMDLPDRRVGAFVYAGVTGRYAL